MAFNSKGQNSPQAAQMLGMSRARIGQIANKALKTMRRPDIRQYLEAGLRDVRRRRKLARKEGAPLWQGKQKSYAAQVGEANATAIIADEIQYGTILIESTNMPPRAKLGLDRSGIKTLPDLCRATLPELCQMRAFGKITVNAIIQEMEKIGVSSVTAGDSAPDEKGR